MRTEIYIENQRLDLFKDISTEFTYNIDDVKDFSARNTNFSKTIVIPGNATNNKLFGHIFEFGSANFYNATADNVGYNFNAAKSAACVIYVDKIQLFKGIIRLLEIVIDNNEIEYECAVFGELGGFVSALGNAKLEDLDFSSYSHHWNITNITGSWNNVSGGTYFYPLIDYGQVSTNKQHYQYKAFRPALYVREYVDKIITNSGYTWESSFFNTNLFKRLVIPNNKKDLSTSTKIQFTGYDELMYYSIGTASGTTTIGLVATKLGAFTDISNYQYQYTSPSLTATAYINLTGESSVPDFEQGSAYLGIYKNGTLQTEYALAEDRQDFDRQIELAVNVSNGDYIDFRIRYTGVTDGMSITFYTFSLSIETSSVVDTPLSYNEFIDINETIPKGIFQKDFFSSILKMFNLYVTESTEKSKHLIITPYIDYYDFNNTQDWTLKIDRSKPFRLKPMSELNGRYFEYKYKPDADFFNENYQKKYSQGYGDYIEDTGFEFANDKQTAEIIFAASTLVGYQGDDKVMAAIYKKSNTQNTTSEDKIDSIIRIMQVKKITGVAQWKIENGNANLSGNIDYYGYGGHLDDPDAPAADINFGAPKEIYFTLTSTYPSANLFNGYWSDYVAEISDKDSKLLTCNVRLTDIDIFNLNFSKPIWIDGTLWRLNKVIDYNPMVEDTTKCEFIKVIEQTYA